jgi:hypothetical protein
MVRSHMRAETKQTPLCLLWYFAASVSAVVNGISATAQPAGMWVLFPVSHQVIQRVAYEPTRADQHELGGPALGYGNLRIEVQFSTLVNGTFQYRTMLLNEAFGKAVDWTTLKFAHVGNKYSGMAKLPAGGWYRLEVRFVEGAKVIAVPSVEPIGTGQVFLIAGQSNAGGYSDALTRIEDTEGRVVAYNVEKKIWAVANDPQPNVGPGATIWPAMCNALLLIIQAPIGLVNLAVENRAKLYLLGHYIRLPVIP